MFDDPTDSGQFSSGDTGLSGWTVELVQGSNVLQTTSGSGGAYSFSNVGPGSWTLEVIQQTGWVAPNSPVTITPTSGTNITDEYLGEFQGQTISGQVFNDIAGSGTYASGDPGLSGLDHRPLERRRQRGRQCADRRERRLHARWRCARKVYRRGSRPRPASSRPPRRQAIT